MKFLPLSCYLLFFFCFFSPFYLSAQTQADEQVNRKLYQLLNSRLAHMQAVALYKWQHKKPIEDLTREQLVIDNSVAKAVELGLTAKEITPFFQVQISLAKKIQGYYHKLWAEQGLPKALLLAENNPSLEKIRAQLITLGAEIITRLSKSEQQQDFAHFTLILDHPALDINDKAALFQVLSQVKAFAYGSRLDRIVAEKILYVGTSGDYQPFSFYRAGKRVGIDIMLARALARTLGAQAVFLPTSWPGLLTDLASGEYDIMMSGISKKLFRQQLGLFSDSYHTGGKTPVSLCRQKHKFASLAQIDRPDRRIIVNKGGTNERFVNQHIKQAQVLLHDDNTTVFEQILAGRADVMITDQIEVAVQVKKHPELCATMVDTRLSYSAKAFLLNRDLIWLEYINTWLEQIKNDGVLEQAFAQYL
ncbi:gamma subclass chorismate mutase AroQ [Thalassomonas haliotis]|uniref:chorismate mutase n=1 Tax=Thalassomonas haliotis TaxID=485448 RepID=A0ABY7VMH6_9GAMM|nr:gamma subclass chorismate mutase AroQ [Thalassomonas haliotis]WDE14186.1 gamma subclass chorismate mutase AroQ [Thalassomonas haliotis]